MFTNAWIGLFCIIDKFDDHVLDIINMCMKAWLQWIKHASQHMDWLTGFKVGPEARITWLYTCRLWICACARFYHACLCRCFDNTVLLKQSAYRKRVLFLGRYCDVLAYKNSNPLPVVTGLNKTLSCFL